MKALAVDYDLVTAWGPGVEACWRNVVEGRSAFAAVDRFATDAFPCRLAALVPGLDARAQESLVMQMLRPMLAPLAARLPPATLVLLATTAGEVDLLERHLLGGRAGPDDSRLDRLLERVRDLCGAGAAGRIISAACASSSAALAHGAALIAAGQREAVLVVACDAVTEFVYAGFSALMALDPDGARPFDRRRKGLTVGAQRRPRGEVAGWGLSAAANHMTGPSRDGAGLAMAIRKALTKAGVAPPAIGSISAHGTGTPYNDAMEMKAIGRVFGPRPVPVYSVKGSLGHTLGAAGLVETILAFKSLEEKTIPPSANLHEVDPEAAGWVWPHSSKAPDMDVALSMNSGFGGVNAALVLRA